MTPVFSFKWPYGSTDTSHKASAGRSLNDYQLKQNHKTDIPLSRFLLDAYRNKEKKTLSDK